MVDRMPDEGFEHPRLVGLYDFFEADRDDLVAYLDLVERLGARSVLDLGCGTGTFALLLADRGIEVTGVDPAAGSLAVARAKDGADRVRWVHGDARSIPAGVQVDAVTMTGNAAQAIVDPADWDAALSHSHTALRTGGHLVFETRDPARRAWQEWNRESSYGVADIPGVGAVTTWVDLTEVDGPLVSFRWTWVFAADGQTLTSDSTLRFRERDEVSAGLVAHGYIVDEVRDAPDRPGRELVFIARRPQ
jgi:SAM-dependent methyltransferase